MNPLGVHGLVFVSGWSELESERAINAAADHGFQVIEIPLLDPAGIDPGRTRRQLERAGIDPVVWVGLDFANDVSSGDPELVARGEAHLNAALDAACDLGARMLTGVLYSALGRHSGPPTAAGRWNCIRVLRRIAERAAQSDITLGLEVVNRYEGNLINSAVQALDLIREIDAENVVVHLDSFHMNIEESDPAAAIGRCGDRLGYLHVAESHRGHLGTGTIDFGALFTALAKIGYQGTITFEAFSASAGDPSLNAKLAIWRQIWSYGDDLARHARQFMAAECGAAQHRVT